MAVALGMEPTQALRAGTTKAAEAIGLGNESGQLARRYSADVVALGGALYPELRALASILAS